MKVQCPQCGREVPTANLSLNAGWGKCDECKELFLLAEVVPGFPAPGSPLAEPPPRPFDARVIIERTAEELLIHVPSAGMNGGAWASLAFAAIPVAIAAFGIASILGVFGEPPTGDEWVAACFSIPFMLIGVGLMALVVWTACGSQSVCIDPEGMTVSLHLQGWSWSKWIERERMQFARLYEPVMKADGVYPQAVEIVYGAVRPSCT